MIPLKKKYGQTIIYLILLIVFLFLMGLTRNCTNRLPVLKQGNSSGDTIDVAMVYGPMSYYIYADTLGGLNYDLIRIFERETGTPVKLWPIVSLKDALSKLEDRTYDMIASLPADSLVKKRFLTTESLFLDRMVLIQLADSGGNEKINSVLDLMGDSIYVQADSPAILRLDNLSDEIGAPIKVIQDNESSEEYLCMKVANGIIPYAIVNEATARRMNLEYPFLSYDNPISFTQFQIWALNPSDSILLNNVNRWIESFVQTDAYRELIDRY